MFNILFGICLVCLGICGIITNWWSVVDFITVMVPVLLLIVGAFSIMAGLSRLSERANQRH